MNPRLSLGSGKVLTGLTGKLEVIMAGNVFNLLSKPLRQQIESNGWTNPTKIQEIAFPEILKGENVLLIAPTGTGKTEAAVLPVLELLLRKRSQERAQGISILYITPLRALNRDIFRRLIEVGERLDIRIEVRHGDTSKQARRLQALKPPDMLITTPETFQAIMPGTRMRRHLQGTRWIIIDEIHELITDERGAQLSIGLERLEEITGTKYQRIGLSATVGNEDQVGQFLVGTNNTVRVLRTVETKDIEVTVESPSSQPEDERLAQDLMISSSSVARIKRIIELVNSHQSVLIFTNTREHAETLSSRILALQPDARIGIHHGSLSKEVRMETENELKDGRLKAVVCTSSLELGIDVGDIDFVIQYMSPRQVTKLVQRIGRSGHIVGGKSLGTILASWPDDIVESAVISKFAEEGVLEETALHSNALDVMAHQVAGLALEWGRVHIDDVMRVIARAWLFRDVSRNDLLDICRQLEQRRIIWFTDDDMIRRRFPNIFDYYYGNLSMITDVRHYDVVDYLNKRRIGTLDQEFIARNGKSGQEFVIFGHTWRILSVDDDESLVQVEPVSQTFGAIPAWEGELIPVSYEVAQRVGLIRSQISEKLENGEEPVDSLTLYRLTKEAAEKVVDLIKRQSEGNFPIPTDKRIVIESYENYVVIHSCLGSLINEVLGKALASILSGRFGINVGTQSDPYRIVFIASIYIDPETVRKDLAALQPEEIDSLLEATLSDTSLLSWRLWNVAKRFGIVERKAEFSSSRGRILANAMQGTPVYREALREIYVEKMDVANTKRVLSSIQKGELEIVSLKRRKEYSPLALPILDRIAPQDVLRPVVPTQVIMDAVKERLNAGQTRLVCLYKGDYDSVRSIRSLPEKIRCPKCGSSLIASTYRGDDKLLSAVRKRISKTKTSPEENKSFETAWLSANLIQSYGKEAALVMAGRGVGPTTASRILQRFHKTENDLYLDILRAERNYVRTRMFWEQ